MRSITARLWGANNMAGFVWGDGGAALSQDEIAQRRKVALAMAARAGDTSPVQHWTQGLNRVAQGIMAGLELRDADKAEKENAAANSELLGGVLGASFGTGGTASAPSASSTATASTPDIGDVKASYTPPGTTPAFKFDANQVGRTVFDTMTAGGLQPHQAAGFLGNFVEESSLNPGAWNKAEGAGGLGQWRGPRLAALQSFAQQNGTDFRDPAIQAKFALNEISTDPQYRDAWARLQAAKTPQEAADAVIHWEKPGGWKRGNATGVPSYNDRVNHAIGALRTYGAANPADIPAPNASPAAMEGQGQGFVVPPGGPDVAMTEEDVRRLEAGMMPPQTDAQALFSPAPMGPQQAFEGGQDVATVPQSPPIPPARPVPQADMPAPGATVASGPAPQMAPAVDPAMLAAARSAISGGSNTRVMELNGPNRESMIRSVLQGDPRTAQRDASKLDPIVAALMGRDGGSAPVPAQAPQTASPAAYASLPAQSPEPASTGSVAAPPASTQAVAQAAMSGMDPAILRALTDPRASAGTRQVAMAMLQQRMAAAKPDYATVAPGATILDQKTGKVIFRNDPKPEVLSPEAEAQKIRIAQASRAQTTINNNTGGGDDEFYKEIGKKSATMFSSLEDEGYKAQAKVAQLDRLEQILSSVPTGGAAALKLAAGQYGIKTEGLDDLQAAQALISQLVPQQRPAGSGTMSDKDIALFTESLPRIINQPGGNQMIMQTMRGITQYTIEQGKIASDVANRTITPAEGRARLNKLENPLADFNKAIAGGKGGGKGSAERPAPTGVDATAWKHMTPEERALWN